MTITQAPLDLTRPTLSTKEVLRFLAYNPVLHRLLDLIVILSCGALAFWVRMGGLYLETLTQPAVQAYLFSAWTTGLLLWVGLGLYRASCAFTTWRDVGYMALMASSCVGLSMVSGYMTDRLIGLPRSLPIFHFGFLMAGLCVTRVFARTCASITRDSVGESAFARQDCILFGEMKLASIYIELLRSKRKSTNAIAGLITSEQIDREILVNSVPILGKPEDAKEVLLKLKIHGIAVRQLVLLADRREIPESLLSLLDKEGIEIVDFYKPLFGEHASRLA